MNAALCPLTLWPLGSPSGPEHRLEALNTPVLHWLSPYSGPRNSGPGGQPGEPYREGRLPLCPQPLVLLLHPNLSSPMQFSCPL